MTDALERLIEAVAKGTLGNLQVLDCGLPFVETMKAYNGDLNAALTLLAAFLPDHDWGRAPGGNMWVRTQGGPFVWSGDGYPPARGLLLAILRACAAEVSADAPEASPTQPAT